jgi:predicted nuclease with RNAse H fold
VITLGIDLAAQPEKTGACLVEWKAGTARVKCLEVGWDDGRIQTELDKCDKCAIDVPLGWPQAFVETLQSHQAGRPWFDGEFDKSRLYHRVTDKYVRREVKKVPLSVSTDRIGVPALRAAAILSGRDVDRSGEGLIVEVYPAAALCRWGFDPFEHDGVSTRLSYKGKKGGLVREHLVSAIRKATAPWLIASNHEWDDCVRVDHLLDALICSLNAGAAALSLTDPVPSELRRAVLQEGWIALPKAGSLENLREFSINS